MTAGTAYHLYVDGSYEPTLNHGGWGVVVVANSEEIAALSGGLPAHDNGEAELFALYQALVWLSKLDTDASSTIWSDSHYAVNGCNRWRHIWRTNGWKRRPVNGRGRARPVPNAALWQMIDRHLQENTSVEVAWCKGHDGQIWNERADGLAASGRFGRAGGGQPDLHGAL